MYVVANNQLEQKLLYILLSGLEKVVIYNKGFGKKSGQNFFW